MILQEVYLENTHEINTYKGKGETTRLSKKENWTMTWSWQKTQQPLRDLWGWTEPSELSCITSWKLDWCLQTGENPWWQEGRDENRIINALHMNLCWYNPGTPGSYSGRGTGKQMFKTWELLPKNRMRWCRTTLKGHSSLGHRRPPIMRLLLEQEVKMYIFFDRKTKLKQADPTDSHPMSQL